MTGTSSLVVTTSRVHPKISCSRRRIKILVPSVDLAFFTFRIAFMARLTVRASGARRGYLNPSARRGASIKDSSAYSQHDLQSSSPSSRRSRVACMRLLGRLAIEGAPLTFLLAGSTFLQPSTHLAPQPSLWAGIEGVHSPTLLHVVLLRRTSLARLMARAEAALPEAAEMQQAVV